ncbi:hypothetical protein Hanom_Chr04g00335991 [Helianthus anomalus]
MQKCELQQEAFANYLLIQKHPMVMIMKSASIVRQKMDWMTESNGIDCGIFAMRHMETYMGQMAGWECGLAKEDAPNDLQQKQLNDLKIKYIAKILLRSQNENRRKVVKSLNKLLELGAARISELHKTGNRRIEQRMEEYVD